MFYHTVDGGNPAPPGMYKTLWILGYLLHQLVSRISEPSSSTYYASNSSLTVPPGGWKVVQMGPKKNAALMLSASQLVFFSSWRKPNTFRVGSFLELFAPKPGELAVRNAPMFFFRQRNGPPKNRGVPWQNSRLWQKKRRENNKYPPWNSFLPSLRMRGESWDVMSKRRWVVSQLSEQCAFEGETPDCTVSNLAKWKMAPQFNLIQEQAKNCTVYSLPILISDTQIAFKGTKWAPTRSKWGYTVIPPKWPCKWVTGLLE